MNKWQKKKLSEVATIIGGGTPKRSEDTYWNGTIPFAQSAKLEAKTKENLESLKYE
ncbi:restriction endonuclease subunit S [Neisseria yangbaofengii]|uniref:restriction endonuclease subunit S n=1 Tax=Neisseria yangbaofengii TaxID=2709396 RepID=UPI0013ECDD98|nr:restriction endonuclease subunit S [Neisseria yangbaofengii]